jgi:hypothetical protein
LQLTSEIVANIWVSGDYSRTFFLPGQGDYIYIFPTQRRIDFCIQFVLAYKKSPKDKHTPGFMDSNSLDAHNKLQLAVLLGYE